MRIPYKKMTYEDKWGRKYYCSYINHHGRAVRNIKRNNRKKVRRILKECVDI
jgi:hypothetical protein